MDFGSHVHSILRFSVYLPGDTAVRLLLADCGCDDIIRVNELSSSLRLVRLWLNWHWLEAVAANSQMSPVSKHHPCASDYTAYSIQLFQRERSALKLKSFKMNTQFRQVVVDNPQSLASDIKTCPILRTVPLHLVIFFSVSRREALRSMSMVCRYFHRTTQTRAVNELIDCNF